MAARASSRHSSSGRNDLVEVGKSFVAGGAYAAGVVLVGGLITATLTQSALPTFIDAVAPDRMPRYTVHEIARAERFNPDQWSFPKTGAARQTARAQPDMKTDTAMPAGTPIQIATAD